MIPIKGKYSTAHIMVDDPDHVVGADEYKQILEFVNCHVFTNDPKLMPDYHYGAGCPVGLVMPLTHRVIPNIVGVDLFCNMLYIDFQKRFDWSWDERAVLDEQLRKLIPTSFKQHVRPAVDIYSDFPWKLATLDQRIFTSNLNNKFNTTFEGPEYTPEWFFDLCERVGCVPKTAINSIGTLGGGNHFIEFSQSDETGNTGVTLHSGSRNLGLRIALYWQGKAKEYMEKLYITDRNKEILKIKCDSPMEHWDALIKGTKKPPTATGLEYLEGDDWYSYLHEIHFAKAYSLLNLQTMGAEILKVLGLSQSLMLHKETHVHTVHNCITFEDFIIRKGAVRSVKGEKMLIPFNMEDGILICEGKSNPDYYDSAPHGAGRMFGRNVMKRRKDINTRDIRDRMKDNDIFISVLPKDEVKEAYKDPAFIEEAIKPTATIVDRLRPIWTMKARK